MVARLATTCENLVASRPNPVALASPQVVTSSPEFWLFTLNNMERSVGENMSHMSVFAHFLSAIPLPKCFTTEQSKVQATLFALWWRIQ